MLMMSDCASAFGTLNPETLNLKPKPLTPTLNPKALLLLLLSQRILPFEFAQRRDGAPNERNPDSRVGGYKAEVVDPR